MNEIEQADLAQIEVEINFYKGQAVQSVLEIGKRLIKAKELVPYGEWGKWLEEKAEFSHSMANKFMKVANEFSDSELVPKVGLSKLIMLTTVDQEERREFIEENPVEDMTRQELRQAIKEKKELEKQVEELKNQEAVVIEKEIERTVEVVPNDYYTTKQDALEKEEEIKELKSKLTKLIDPTEYERIRKELNSKNIELYDLKKQIEQAEVIDTKEVHIKRLKDTALTFNARVHRFINDIGGLGWLIEYLDELPGYEKNEYIKAINLLDKWVTTIKSNLGGN